MGPPVELSAEQLRAILTPGDLFVRAGAGSGKTEVLARRFVALVAGDIEYNRGSSAPIGQEQIVAEDITPESIAAVTFSEKAAYDMRQRIAAVLAERIAQESGELRIRLLRAQRSLPLARIITLHAFCARILRENALSARLDPAFEVIDEYESAVFLERACQEALLAALRAGDAGALHLTAARRLRGSAHREGALQIVLRLISELQRGGRTAEWLADRAQNLGVEAQADRAAVKAIARQIVELAEELLAARDLTRAAAASVETLRQSWPDLRQALAAFDADAPPAALGPLRELPRLLPAARSERIKATVKRITELIRKDAGKIGLSGELIEAWGAQRAAGPTLAVARLIARVADTITTAKREHAVVTFDDLLLMTRGLLRDNPYVVKRYRQSLRAILVDEFQDTDPIQDEIIATLRRADDLGTAPSLFIVGDEKQSIYRFRGADVTVFGARRKAGFEVLPLRHNRRSTPNIVNFVNAFGASMMRSEAVPPPPHWVHWTDDHQLIAVRDRTFDPPVEILSAVECKTAMAGRKLEAIAIANRINAMITDGAPVLDSAAQAERPARHGDIAILMRAFTDVAIYESALRSAGIPCYTVKGRGLFGCQEIIDLCELLTAVNDPANSLALAAALRSPFFTLSDDCLLEIAFHLRDVGESEGAGPSNLAAVFAPASEPDFGWLEHERAEALAAWHVLHELRLARGRCSITALIEFALELTGFEAVMIAADPSRQRAANLRRLLELARTFEAHQFFTFHDFVAYLRRLVDEEPREPQAQILGENESVVRLMTVHQAKGLEFPIVIVADMARGTPPNNLTPLLSPTRGLILCDTIGAGYDEIPNHRLSAFRKAIADQEAAESARILYVAITRARDRLLLSEGALPRKEPGRQSWLWLLRRFLAEQEISSGAQAGDNSRLSEFAGVSLVVSPANPTPLGTAVQTVAIAPEERERFAASARARLEFIPPAAESVVMSPSELEVLARCPREYYLRYLAKLPEGRDRLAGPWTAANEDADASDAANNPLRMGLAAHGLLEQLSFGAGGTVDNDELRRMAGIIRVQHDLTQSEYAAIERDLARYLAKAIVPAGASIEREVPFMVKIGDHPELFVRGRIDLLAVGATAVTVRDYKYAHPADAALYQMQMEVYALAAAEAYPGRRINADLIFLRDAPSEVPVALPPLDSIRERLLDLARESKTSRANNAWRKKPASSSACRKLGCGYVMRCWGLT